MHLDAVLQELERLGSAQRRKICANRGAAGAAAFAADAGAKIEALGRAGTKRKTIRC